MRISPNNGIPLSSVSAANSVNGVNSINSLKIIGFRQASRNPNWNKILIR